MSAPSGKKDSTKSGVKLAMGITFVFNHTSHPPSFVSSAISKAFSVSANTFGAVSRASTLQL